ncbi:hypothetical protein GCM10028808_67560 [Spirosoma migulaei]
MLGLASSVARTGTSQLATASLAEPLSFTPYIRIDSTGAIIIFNTKPEMGQGVFQSIPALICEELEVTMDQVTIKQSNGEKELGPMQRAGGSASIRIEIHILAEGGKVKGVGEPGLPALAPALANAIFAASGKRFRKMPFSLNTV